MSSFAPRDRNPKVLQRISLPTLGESDMKLDIKALYLTSGLFQGSAILTIGIANIYSSTDYGESFLNMVASIYPGYNTTSSAGQGRLYGFFDSVIGGTIFGLIYNFLSNRHLTEDTEQTTYQ